MATVRYDKRILRRLRRHTLFIITPPPSMEQYNVTLQRAKEKITAFYTEIEKYLSNDTYGGRCVPYNIPNKDKYKYLIYTDPFSKVRWGVIYEDMGELRIVRILEQERFLASRFQIKENRICISESDLRLMISKTLSRLLEEKNAKDYTYKPIGSHKFWTNGGKTEWKSIVTLQTPYSKQCCHIAEDDHCYVLFNGSGLKDKNCKMINWIFPEAFEALKSLPPLR